MTKIILMAMLMLLPLLTFAQTENNTTYIVDIGHNRDCRGGLGTCSGTTLTTAKEKTTASVNKISKNQLEVTLYKAGFTAKEWQEMLDNKTFPIDDESITIDRDLLSSIDIDITFNTIKKGVYSVTLEKDKATFVLELFER